MFIKYLDYLSPPITFYHKGYLTHSSLISIIISIVAFLIIFILAINFSLDIILRRNPTAYYFNRFIDDAGLFPLNASGFFHFLSIAQNTSNNFDNGIDFTSYRIVGLEMYYDIYLSDKNLSKYNHWLYGFCNNESDTEGLGYLIKYKFFEQSACIRKYFNNKTQKYYDTNDPNFKWPIIAHGTYNPDAIYYTIIIERCKKETLNLILGKGFQCRNESEMDILFTNIGATHLFYIDHYIDVLDYDNPNMKYFYNIENGLHKNDFSVNHLNINPSSIRTHKGLIFESYKEELTYIVDRNDVFTYENKDDEIYMVYYFWLKNKIHYYERSYKRVQDVTSSIGGIYQIVTVIAMLINKLFNNYTVLSDTETLLFSSIYSEKNNNKKSRLKYEQQNIKKNEKDLMKDNLKKNQLSDNSRYNSEKTRNKIIQSKTSNEISKNIHNNSNSEFKNQIDKSREYINIILNEDNNQNKNNKNMDKKFKSTNFWNFFLFKLSCERKKSMFKIFKKFRIKIISEEHLIRNHLNIYNLLKEKEKKRNFKRYSYQLKDLINLV